MRNHRFVLNALLALCALLFATSSFAQATRTWVSGVGDDANPCSRTAPCKTFAGAISKTASGGIIDALDPGGFGTVTITKSITIEGTGTLASILASGVNGVVVNAGATDVVVLRNLAIDGAGTTIGTNGVRFLNGAKLSIENCTIQTFSGSAIDFEPSAAAQLTVADTILHNNGSGGPAVLVAGSTAATPNATLQNVHVTLNGGYGVLVKNGIVAIRNSTLSQNYYGIKAFSSTTPAQITLDDSIIDHSTSSAVSTAGTTASITLSRSTITGNNVGIAASSTVASFGDNRIFGNTTDGSPSSTIMTH